MRDFQSSETEESWRARVWRALVLLSAVATLLMLRVSNPLWRVLPELQFVQFPWRWMSIVAVPWACFMGMAIYPPWRANHSSESAGRKDMARGFRWTWATATFLSLAATAGTLAYRTWWDVDDLPTLHAALVNDQGFEGSDEYDPAGDDHYNLPKNAPRARFLPMDEEETAEPGEQQHISIIRWTPEQKELQVNAPSPARIALRLLDHPAWRLELNGQKIQPEHADDSGQMIVPVPAGDSRVIARFTRTRDRTVGGTLSIGSFLLALGVLVSSKPREKV